jgi:uncharacterized protein
MPQKIVLAGGTGFIGSYLHEKYSAAGYAVQMISRQPGHISWEDQAGMVQALEGAALVINLAGKQINCRFTAANKEALIQSRVSTTRAIGSAIQQCSAPPPLWLNASGAHIYGTSFTHGATEQDIANGTAFPAVMAREWEAAFFGFRLPGTRQVALRISIVLGKGGGVLQPFLRLVRLGMGGTQGSGKQLFSWIHIEDLFRITLFLAEHREIEGPVNISSPQPLSNREMMQTLRKVLHMPFGFPAPEWAIRLGGKMIGTEPELLLDSVFVLPGVLQDAGFPFRYPDLESAVKEISGRQ